MPITGNLNQENSPDEPVGEYGLVDTSQVTGPSNDQIQASDCSGAEVSSTTVDLDPSIESALTHSTEGATTLEPVQSTSSIDISDSLDGFKDEVSLPRDSVSKANSSASVTSQVSKGFQDAFAAFASASFRNEEEEVQMDTNDETKLETVVSAAADSAGTVSIEPLVSSAIDSGLVTTTGEESLVKSEQEGEVAFGTLDAPVMEQPGEVQMNAFSEPGADSQSFECNEQAHVMESVAEPQAEAAAATDSVYFIQMTDATGQVVTSIIDPNDIPSYADSVVYKQCMLPNGEIETTIVYQGGVPVTQEEQQTEDQVTASQETTEQVEQQIIYVHDANGQLTPIDSAQSANDVAPLGKQFVYMQDSTGRIIRTIMDANQTMVPGQQVYYTQSDDGRIITSVMDSATAGVSDDGTQQTVDQLYQQQQTEQVYQQQLLEEAQQQDNAAGTTNTVGATGGFNIDNSMSGLSMLAELSHLTAGQAPATGVAVEPRTSSSTESNSVDMDEFRPVAMVTRRVEDGDGISADIAGLKVGEADSYNFDLDQGSSLSQEDSTGQEDSVVGKILSEMKSEHLPGYSVSRDNLFVQWQNLDAMCWMDVVLIMLVYSPTLRPLVNLEPTHELASTLLITLLKANRQAQVLLQNLLKKSNGAEISGLQTGAGNTASLQDPKTSKLVCKENMDEIGKAINILYAMREKIWQALQPRLRCERGKHNSPVLVLPLLVREKPAIKQMFTMNYRYVFKCERCGYSQDDSHTKILPSIPAVPADFNMKTPSFVRNCFECQAPNQRMLMKFEGLQDFVQMHFVKGLPHNRFDELSFDFNDDHYEVTAVVHYKNNPDHFIAWVRNAPGSTWMECDDLKSVITRYLHVSPNIPAGQVHMVMWERRLTSQHTLVMRDTEDTKLLASLVLTVQQPNTHQSTDPAARPTGVPSAPSFPSASTPQTSSLLSGLGTQTQTFTPYTPRGRGRGRGSRGSYGGRGRGATTAMPVRRATPTTITQITPTGTSTLQARSSPQIVRLPMSALTGSTLRGGTMPGARYVLVGNSQAGTSGTGSGGTSKVVVVRSQGSTSNITATQLLQLLQRTGALNQAGSRITTTTSGSGTSSTSYIVQPDGTLVTTGAPDLMEASSQQTTEQAMQDQSDPSFLNSDGVAEQIQESPETDPEKYGEESSHVSTHAEHQISTLPFPTATATPIKEHPETIIVSPDAGMSPTAASEAFSSESAVKTLLTQNQQQPSRYIQIPNPSGGGGTILTQLVMRGGKMVLVPVDKNTQAQVTGTSVLKLPNSPSGSPKIAIRAGGTNPQIISASSAGALLSQLQQQQSQGIISLSQISGISTATMSNVGAQRRITLPAGNAAGKKTIQVITVPRSANAAQINQAGTKTIMMSSSSSPQTTTTASVGSPRLATPVETTTIDGRILSQSGNIVIRELKRGETETVTTMTTSLGSTSQLTPTPAVSLLRDVSARSSTSLLTTSPTSQQQKLQESFRYILPGSSTTHILHTGASGTQGNIGSTGRAFTALSASGTIIGGQLTPSPTTSAIGTSPMDQDMALGDSDDSSSAILMPNRRLIKEMDTTEYIPLGRGRAKTRGGRGRGRGGRTPRGRGRAQIYSPDADYMPPLQVSNRKISTLPADLRQIGAHVIESSTESVDGVPVVSIPELPNLESQQTETENFESAQVADALEPTIPSLPDTQVQSCADETQENQATELTLSPQGPRVITQPIPSIKANHGFDILTQGILGGAANRPPSLSQAKQARSLLTGSPVSIAHTVSSDSTSVTTILDASTILDTSSLTSVASKTQQTLSLGQSVSQAEIDTLIQAAQAAAKPSKPAVTSSMVTTTSVITQNKSTVSILPMTSLDMMSPQKKDSVFGLEDFVSKTEESGELDDQIIEEHKTSSQELDSKYKQEEESIESEQRIMSVDESQVSAAERYRMPVELFQPDDESPEKPFLRSEECVTKLGVELPSKLFQDSEVSSQDEEIAVTPVVSQKGAARHKTINEIEMDKRASRLGAETAAIATKKLHQKISTKAIFGLEPEDTVSADIDIETAEDLVSVSKPKKVSATNKKQKHQNSSSKKIKKKSSNSQEDLKSDDLNLETRTNVSSLDEKIAQIISSPKVESNARKTPSNIVKPKTSIGGFATDLLMESEKEEMLNLEKELETECAQEIKKQMEEKLSIESGSSAVADSIKLNEKVLTDECMVTLEDNKENAINDAEIASKEVEKPINVKVVRKRLIYPPAFVRHKRHKADWSVQLEEDSTENVLPEQTFNYRVLQGILRPSHRHPSLGPSQELYITFPTPLPHISSKKNMPPVQPAVVKRRNRKDLQRPQVDPSKEPTVIPLVPEDEGDPACTGGSVVTSPINGEIFCGVILKKKSEIADWSSSVEEGEEEEIFEEGVDIKSLQHEYCEQLRTVYFMEAGDLSMLEESWDSNEDCEDVDSEKMSIKDEDTGEEDISLQVEKNIVSDQVMEQPLEIPQVFEPSQEAKNDSIYNVSVVTQQTPVEQTPVVKKKRGRPKKVSTPNVQPTQAQESTGEKQTSFQESRDDHTSGGSQDGEAGDVSSKSTPSRLNGIDTELPAQSQSGTKTDIIIPQRDSVAAPSFPSPSRRSGRTPIPSKRVLDALEDSPARGLLKSRRTSFVSSDDEHSSSSNGENVVKKLKKQSVVPT